MDKSVHSTSYLEAILLESKESTVLTLSLLELLRRPNPQPTYVMDSFTLNEHKEPQDTSPRLSRCDITFLLDSLDVLYPLCTLKIVAVC